MLQRRTNHWYWEAGRWSGHIWLKRDIWAWEDRQVIYDGGCFILNLGPVNIERHNCGEGA